MVEDIFNYLKINFRLGGTFSSASDSTGVNKIIFNLNRNLTPALVQDQVWNYFLDAAGFTAGNMGPNPQTVTDLDI